jgi:hypothetical protein
MSSMTISWRRPALLLLFAATFLTYLSGTVQRAAGQIDDDGWTEVVNLSRSGGVAEPILWVDLAGTVHVLWQDALADAFFYVRGDGVQYGSPINTELPFGTRIYDPDLRADDPTPIYTPLLVDSDAGLIHAFWLDDEGSVFHSTVNRERFAEFAAWSAPTLLNIGVLDLAVTADTEGWLHVAMVRSVTDDQTPSGILSRRSTNDGASWSDPVLHFQSDYFRLLNQDRANVVIDSAGGGSNGRVFIAWDDPITEQVLIRRSADGGQSWAEPVVLDQREETDTLDSVGPSQVVLNVNEDNVQVLWQAGHDSSLCNLHYRWSADGGGTWQPRNLMPGASAICPDSVQAVGNSGLLSLFMLSIQGQLYLQAWDGSQWSESEPQPALSSFVRVDSFRNVVLGCQDLALLGGSQLVAVGCGTGEANDVWATSRTLGDMADWFPPPPVWSTAEVVVSNAPLLKQPLLVADRAGQLHAFWLQASDPNLEASTIYYAQWEPDGWSQAIPLHAAEFGVIGRLTVAANAAGRLFLVWDEGSGNLFFSEADSATVRIAADWSAPQRLPITDASSPSMAVSQDGTLSVAYRSAVNESRGIYLVQSTASGRTWSQPSVVFDGAAAGWQVVGPPHLAATAGSGLQILWTQEALQPASKLVPQALYFSVSEDGGLTFGPPELVIEGSISWSHISGSMLQASHRFWQAEQESGAADLQHQVSSQNGQSWSRALIISPSAGPAAVATDLGGQVYALQLVGDLLIQSSWTGDSWLPEEDTRLEIEPGADTSQTALAAAVSSDGTLQVLIASPTIDPVTGQTVFALFSTSRTVELSAPTVDPGPAPGGAATLVPEPTPTAAAELQPSPTVDVSTLISAQQNSQGTSIASGPLRTAIGLLPALFLILVVLAIALWTMFFRRR